MQATSISDDQVAEVVESVLDTMLGFTLEPSPGLSLASGWFKLAGTIQITGRWNGAVILLCNELFARRAAATMLAISQERTTLADTLDAVAELNNVIGGGIKSVLPGPSSLSFPIVTQGSDFYLQVHGTRQIAQGDLACDGELVQVRVLEGPAV